MTSDPILFLDFDGVLHPSPSERAALFCRMDLLAQWLQTEGNEVSVVISSDWRLSHCLDTLRQYFPPDIQPLVIATLPTESEVNPADWGAWAFVHPRQCLVMAWLQTNRGTIDHPWVALDDWTDGFLPEESRLVRVDGSTGLKPGDLATVSAILNSQRGH